LISVAILFTEVSEHIGGPLRDEDVFVNDECFICYLRLLLSEDSPKLGQKTLLDFLCDAKQVLLLLNVFEVPVSSVFNLNAIESEFIFRREVVLVIVTEILRLRSANSFLAHSSQDNMH